MNLQIKNLLYLEVFAPVTVIPVAFLAAAAAPLLAGVPIAQSLMAVYQVTALADSAAWTAAHNDNDNQAWPERTFRFAAREAA